MWKNGQIVTIKYCGKSYVCRVKSKKTAVVGCKLCTFQHTAECFTLCGSTRKKLGTYQYLEEIKVCGKQDN